MFFTARTPSADALAGEPFALSTPVPVTDDPRLASADFTHDELLCFATDEAPGGELPAGGSWRVAGQRSMARHGASALDTEVTVRLLLPAGSDDDPQSLLSQAMMRLALAMAGPEQGVADERFTGSL